MLPRKGQPVRHTASPAPKSRHRRRLPSGTGTPRHTFGQAKIPPRKPGRAKFQGWLADCIGRSHKPTSFPMLQNYPAAISSLRQSRYNPGIWHYTHVAAAGKAARPHHPATKAACPDCKRPGRPCRITGSATIAIRRRPASHSGRAGIIPYSHSIVAGGFEEMS